MRYPLNTVIRGLETLSRQRPVEIDKEVAEIDAKVAASAEAKENNRDVVAEALLEVRRGVLDGEIRELGGHSMGQTVRRAVHEATRSSPVASQYELDRMAERRGKLLEDRETKNTPVDHLGSFLRVMRMEGETHVSANGLKQAGYDPHLLADAVIAAQGVPDAESAR